MKLSRQKLIIVAAVVGAVLIIAGVVYATWYTHHRQAIIAENAQCRTTLEHPAPPTMMRGPGGALAPVTLVQPCLLQAVPPTPFEILSGNLRFTDIPLHTELKPYTLWDVLTGKNVIGPPSLRACDQSATTTDCSTLPSLSQPEPQPYVPPNPVQPVETWVSATGSVFVSVGDILGAMTVVSVAPFNTGQYSTDPKMMQIGPQNARITLRGPIEITGIGFDGYCMSVSDAASLARLPVLPVGGVRPNITSYFFCFRNGETARQQFGEESRTITVKIDNFELNAYPAEVMTWADLINVVGE